MINTLTHRVIKYYEGEPKKIEHFIKAHAFGKMIGEIEGLNELDQFIMESATIVHDIPTEMIRDILAELEYCEEDTERICYIIRSNINDRENSISIKELDYQIMLEAEVIALRSESDLVVDNLKKDILMTKTGKDIYQMMFGSSRL